MLDFKIAFLLNFMNSKTFIKLVEALTGSSVKFNNPKKEKELITAALSNIAQVNWNQFNELLLLCNKDRISEGFFNVFFREHLNIQDSAINLSKVKDGIKEFRIFAILGFGNFRFAYRILSKLSKDEIKSRIELQEYFKSKEEIEEALENRPELIQNIDKISEKDTYLVGYLSGQQIQVDLGSAIILQGALRDYRGSRKQLRKHVKTYVEEHKQEIDARYRDTVLKSIDIIIEQFLSNNRSASVNDLKIFINTAIKDFEPLKKKQFMVCAKAEKNSDIYLTWDYMDVYIATSMREKWEYKTLYSFVQDLFEKQEIIRKLNLRYFDPTQSFEKGRIDKGLIEGLMLKRAKCTIYSVQETDTLGKDSELAATLAQGKPVIAYVPEITDSNFNKHLQLITQEASKSIEFLRDKLWVLSKKFREAAVQHECLSTNEARQNDIINVRGLRAFLNNFDQSITEYLSKKVWLSIETPWAKDEEFVQRNKNAFEMACIFITIADKHFYNYRAYIFKNHPLGIQINLDTGVANGVLVVRNIDDCAKLLYNIINNKLEFILGKDQKLGFWYLEEKISKCIFRVVTGDIKLTNSFWNFYLLDKEGGQHA